MGNEEDEEPLEAEIPSVRINPKNPTSRKEREHEECGHAVYRSWCASCVEARGFGRQLQGEPLEAEEGERTTSMVAFDCVFLTQENADTFPILICRDNRRGRIGATCFERKGPTASFIPLLKVLQEAMIHSCVEVVVSEMKRQFLLNVTQVRGSQMTFRYSTGFLISQCNFLNKVRTGRGWKKAVAQFREKIWFFFYWRRR